MPDKLGGAHLATLVMHPDIHEMISLMAHRSNDGFWGGKLIVHYLNKRLVEPLAAYRLYGARRIKNNKDYLLNPPADYNLNPGERIIVLGSKAQIEKVRALI